MNNDGSGFVYCYYCVVGGMTRFDAWTAMEGAWSSYSFCWGAHIAPTVDGRQGRRFVCFIALVGRQIVVFFYEAAEHPMPKGCLL